MNKTPFFTVPADYKTKTIAGYVDMNRASCAKIPIREVYGSVREVGLSSGRHDGILPDCSVEDLKKYIQELKIAGIHYNYTFNASCLGGNELREGELAYYSERLRLLWNAGVRRFTVTLPSVIDMMQIQFPEAEIYLSVMAGVDSLEKLKLLSDRRKIAGVYVHERLIRQLPELRAIADYCHHHGMEAGILVNSLCDVECPIRAFHYSMLSHSGDGQSAPNLKYYGAECNLRRIHHPSLVLRMPWVRPEDMNRYAELGITRFKFAGRDLVKHFQTDFGKAVEYYNAGHFAGNLTELFFAFAHNEKGALIERADLYHLENTPELGEYLNRIFNNPHQCYPCTECGECDSLCSGIFPDSTIKEQYIQIYEQRIREGEKLFVQRSQ